VADTESQLTGFLKRAAAGDSEAREQAFATAYDELHRLANIAMRTERHDHTLQATALVNEAAIRLLGQNTEWANRRHFFGIAANAMRRILVDHARARNAEKRGGGMKRIELSGHVAPRMNVDLDAVLTLDDLLTKLETLDKRKSRVVELRYFAGLEETQIADVLGVSRSTVSKDWAFTRAWLSVRLGELEATDG